MCATSKSAGGGATVPCTVGPGTIGMLFGNVGSDTVGSGAGWLVSFGGDIALDGPGTSGMLFGTVGSDTVGSGTGGLISFGGDIALDGVRVSVRDVSLNGVDCSTALCFLSKMAVLVL